MMPADYDLSDADIRDYEAIDRFANYAKDHGLMHHLGEARETFLPLGQCYRDNWHKLTNPVGWHTYRTDPTRDVFVTKWGVVGEARDWLTSQGYAHAVHFHAKEAAPPVALNSTIPGLSNLMAYSLSLGFVIRFKDQKDAALFRLFWSDRVGA